jgi:NAD(P)-dependent dehydrogenase (short-subunit alcohol dehydrogenase family)
MLLSKVLTHAKTLKACPLRRTLATRRATKLGALPQQVLDALPAIDERDAFLPTDPGALVRGPVTAAHMIDTDKQQVSTLDSAALSPSGSVLHGRYGDLGDAAAAVPLEYLALLRPAAEAAAALRITTAKAKTSVGTFLVYGASQANGLAAVQLAAAAGHAVVAVVGGEHSGDEDMMELVKGLTAEPGTAVPEEYALSKQNFATLVQSISSGDEGIPEASADAYLADFKEAFVKYTEAYPATRPAAVDAKMMEFKYMEKDRENWEINMEAYLSQFPPGAPPVDPAKLDALFSTEQYEIFRQKFWKQTSAAISGDKLAFSPPHIVKSQIEAPESLSTTNLAGASTSFPFSFSALHQTYPPGTEAKAGGPILGAAIAVTPALKAATEKVAAAGKTKRAKAEALQFLSKNQRAAFGAAASVAAAATKAGAPIVVMGGSLPGLTSAKETPADVQTALAAMDIDENGETSLNFFVELYRANDFPFYADYAIYKASEELPGARQIVVTK